MYNAKITFAIADQPNHEATLSSILQEVCAHFGGATLHSHQGGYIMSNGLLIVEPSYTLEIVFEETLEEVKTAIQEIAEQIKITCNQESVLVQISQLAHLAFVE